MVVVSEKIGHVIIIVGKGFYYFSHVICKFSAIKMPLTIWGNCLVVLAGEYLYAFIVSLINS